MSIKAGDTYIFTVFLNWNLKQDCEDYTWVWSVEWFAAIHFGFRVCDFLPSVDPILLSNRSASYMEDVRHMNFLFFQLKCLRQFLCLSATLLCIPRRQTSPHNLSTKPPEDKKWMVLVLFLLPINSYLSAWFSWMVEFPSQRNGQREVFLF